MGREGAGRGQGGVGVGWDGGRGGGIFFTGLSETNVRSTEFYICIELNCTVQSCPIVQNVFGVILALPPSLPPFTGTGLTLKTCRGGVHI